MPRRRWKTLILRFMPAWWLHQITWLLVKFLSDYGVYRSDVGLTFLHVLCAQHDICFVVVVVSMPETWFKHILPRAGEPERGRDLSRQKSGHEVCKAIWLVGQRLPRPFSGHNGIDRFWDKIKQSICWKSWRYKINSADGSRRLSLVCQRSFTDLKTPVLQTDTPLL